MSISSTIHHKRQFPVDIVKGGPGSFIFDPVTETVQAVTVARQSNGDGPSKGIGRISSRTDAANTQNVENTSKEHSKTELQRLNQKTTQIKVHEIKDDDNNDDSMKMNTSKAAETSQITAA
jgi:hypothetical protein